MPNDPFDIDSLRLKGTAGASFPRPPATVKPPRHGPGEWFLRGPVPWAWLEQAARLPGKALALSLVLWREAGRKNRREVRLSLARVCLGVSEQAARRALRQLAGAGLVFVRRLQGRSLEVTINDGSDGVPSTEGT
jgi:hypothetical protein